MSDDKGMKKRIIAAVQGGDDCAIDDAIREIWADGFQHGEESVLWDRAEEDEMLPDDSDSRK